VVTSSPYTAPRVKQTRRMYIVALKAVAKLADELCTAFENAEMDVGGSRGIKAILGDMGPATVEVQRRKRDLDNLDKASKRNGAY
jgi:hypothetical protein